MPPVVRKFNCTQQQLYAVARAAWASCLARLAAFTALKAKYVALFITNKLAAVTAAEALPDEEQRKEVPQLLREQLSVKAETCRDFWQRLKLYIEEAFPENELDIVLSAAGQSHYEAAGRDNWDAVKRLMIDGKDFITANSVALLAGDNMPATFAADFDDAKTEYETLYNSTVTASLDEEVNTQIKLNANNAVYTDLTSMLKDGQRIFKNDEAVSNLFTFEQILLTIAGPGSTGVKGTAKNSTTNLPLPNVHLAFLSTDEEATTDEEGKFKKVIASGTYTILITCLGFQDLQITDFEIEAGVMKTLNFSLTPLP